VVPAQTSGLARITIRAPRRRLDLAVPDQVPLAEVLPEVLRRAGEIGPDAGLAGAPPGGWALRRVDGTGLAGATALASQGVRDGDVLYLVPRSVAWPEPDYDDVVEEIAVQAQRHGRSWDAGATRLFALMSAGLVLLAGLVTLLAAGPRWTVALLASLAVVIVLLVTGALLSRALGDGVAGATAGAFALPYAAAAGLLGLAGDAPLAALDAGHVLVGAAGLLLASVVGAVGVGHGLRVFTAGVTIGLGGILGALLSFATSGSGAASVVLVCAVGGISVAPLVAVRLGKLPIPVVSATLEMLAAEPRADRDDLRTAVIRGAEILAGVLSGIAVLAVGCATVLAASAGIAAPLLAVLAGLAMLLRARIFPAMAARLPLLTGGVLVSVLAGWSFLSGAGSTARLVAVTLAFGLVAGLLATAGTVHRRTGRSPYLGRLADIVDVVAVLALAPVACAVLDLYSWLRALAG
jgi:type VII secretion integral membrane protein EccD